MCELRALGKKAKLARFLSDCVDCRMKIGRASGILLHLTSLPGRFGIGDLGEESYRFADFLHQAKQKLWHVLPLGPTGPQNSPYQCRSAFAGNALLISPDKLAEEGYLDKRDLVQVPGFSSTRVDFRTVGFYKFRLFRRAFESFAETKAYLEFAKRNATWLDPFAQFMALRKANRGVSWTRFDPTIQASSEEIRFNKFLQYEFFRQWNQLRTYCAERNILIMGDMPFYVEHDSADVWHSPRLFDLDTRGESRTVGGVPPDYFSEDGQLWGNPTYRWDRLAKEKYTWWVERFRAAFQFVDLLRLDHFRGFEKFWKVPAGQSTARKGHWAAGPGIELFRAVRKNLGSLPLIAENLGVITPEVEALRRTLRLPGMAVLQFGFGDDGPHRPTNYVRDLVTFTGTHDNDTTRGWWTTLKRAAQNHSRSPARAEVDRVKAYLQTNGNDISWSFIQAIMTSVAQISLIPMQDVLNLGGSARMNVPGRANGNWGWRYPSKAITPGLITRLRKLTEVSGR
jgi:4-alpha-glucanotransferase